MFDAEQCTWILLKERDKVIETDRDREIERVFVCVRHTERETEGERGSWI